MKVTMTNNEVAYSFDMIKDLNHEDINLSNINGFEVWLVLNIKDKLDYPPLGKTNDGLLIYGLIPQVNGIPAVYSFNLPDNKNSIYSDLISKTEVIIKDLEIPNIFRKHLFINFW